MPEANLENRIESLEKRIEFLGEDVGANQKGLQVIDKKLEDVQKTLDELEDRVEGIAEDTERRTRNLEMASGRVDGIMLTITDSSTCSEDYYSLSRAELEHFRNLAQGSRQNVTKIVSLALMDVDLRKGT